MSFIQINLEKSMKEKVAMEKQICVPTKTERERMRKKKTEDQIQRE